MDATDVRTRILAQFGIRIEPAMSRYVVRELERAAVEGGAFPVMGGDARTGVAVRRFIPAAAFAAVAPQQSSLSSQP